MRIRSRLSKLLVLCLTLALLSSMLMIGTVLGVSAADNGCPGFTPLLDGETFSSSNQYSQKGATVAQETSPSSFGKGFKWTMPATDSNTAEVLASWWKFDTSAATAGQDGFVFYISVPDTIGGDACALYFNLSHGTDGNYSIGVGGCQTAGYTIDENGTVADCKAVWLSTSVKGIQLAKGFSGWVVIPAASLSHNKSKSWSATDSTITTMYLTSDPLNGNDSNKEYHLDEIGLVDDVDAALTYFQALYTNTDEGGEDEEQYLDATVQPHGVGITTLVDFNDKMPVDYSGGTKAIDVSPSQYGKGVSFTLPASDWANDRQMNVQLSAQTAPVAMAGNEALVFWVDVPSTGYNFDMYLWIADAAGGNWVTVGKAPYYTVDTNGKVSTLSIPGSQVFRLADGFSGWVVLPLSSLTLNNDATATPSTHSIYKIMWERMKNTSAPTTGDAVTYYFDEICLAADTEAALKQLADYSYGVEYDWDNTAIAGSSVSPSANATATTETSSSGRGNGLLWTRPSTATSSQMNFTVSAVAEQEGGMAFWMSIDQTDGKQPRFRLLVNASVTTGGSTTTPTWTPDHDSKLYTVTKDGTLAQVTLKDQAFVLPANFSGWVVIPFAGMTVNDTWGGNVTFGDTTNITGFNLYYESANFDPSAIHLDEVGFADDATQLAEQLSYSTKWNAVVNASTFAQDPDVVDLLREVRKTVGGAADSTARATAYESIVENLETVCNANKNNVAHTQDKNGAYSFRFISEIDDAYLLYLKQTYGTAKVEFGTLIARADLYDGVLEYTDLTNKFSKSRATTIKRTSTYAPEGITPVNAGPETTLYTCLISGIPEDYHDSAVRARSYVRYMDAYGVAHTVYGAVKSCSYNEAVAANNASN